MKKFLLDYITCYPGSRHYQTVNQNETEKNEPSWNMENILLETFHRSNVATYQAKDEISNTFNIYLLIAGILAAGLPVVQDLIFRPETDAGFKTFLIITAGTVLLLSGLLSVGFLGRFLQLANERYENTCIMNETQNLYTRKLATTTITDAQEITRIIQKQQSSDQGKSVPAVIRFTVFVLGSVYFSGAFAVFFQKSFFLVLILVPIAIFIVSLALFWWYYLSKTKVRTSIEQSL